MRVTAAIILCATLLMAATSGNAATVLKLATLAPQGSSWMNIINEWGALLERESRGELRLKIYANGVSGDEPDVLRKIRFGQLQGGIFTGYGVGRIYSPARILEMPFFYENIEEIDAVRKDFMPDIEQGFQDNGFEVISWMEVGTIRFFSTKPIESIDDLRDRKIWLWQGDHMAEAFFKAAGIAPIPLSIIDVFTSLSTGLVDTAYSTPLAAIGMQWFNKTQYVTNISLANGTGVITISSRSFKRLSPKLQKLLKDTGKVVGERLIAVTRKDNEVSLQILRQAGLQFRLDWEDVDREELEDIRRKGTAELIKTGYIPADVFARTARILESIRQQKPAALAVP